jgi:hypothetical protein
VSDADEKAESVRVLTNPSVGRPYQGEAPMTADELSQILVRFKRSKLTVSRRYANILQNLSREDGRVVDGVRRAVNCLPTSDMVRVEIAIEVFRRVRVFALENGITRTRAIALLVYREARRRRVDITPQDAWSRFTKANFKLRRFDLWKDNFRLMERGSNPNERIVLMDRSSPDVALRKYNPSKFPILGDLYKHASRDSFVTLQRLYRTRFEEKRKTQQGRRPTNLAREALKEADREVFRSLTPTQKKRVRKYVLERYGDRLTVGEKRIVGRKGLVVPSELK